MSFDTEASFDDGEETRSTWSAAGYTTIGIGAALSDAADRT